ncbi:hypothetical protein FKM82_024698 [Ascaphus truei]
MEDMALQYADEDALHNGRAVKQAPSVFPLRPCCGSLGSQTDVTIGCLATGFFPQPVSVQWNSGAITRGIKNFPAVLGQKGLYTSTSQLTIPESDWESKTFACNVEHKPTSIRVNTNIPGPDCKGTTSEPTVQVLQSSCDDRDGNGSIELVCLISGYSPPDIKVQWLLNGKVTSISPSNSTPCKEEEGTFTSRSEVKVTKSDWNTGDTYTCRVNHPATTTKPEDSIRKCIEQPPGITPKMVLINPSPKDLYVTKEVKIKCVISRMENPETLVLTWTRNDGKRVISFLSQPEIDYDGTYSVTSTLKISLQDWESNKVFTCNAQQNDLPSPIVKTITQSNEQGTDPTVHLFPPPQEELKKNDFVSLICLVTGFSPKDIYIQWKKNDIPQGEEYYSNTEPMQEIEGDNFYLYSKLLIARSDWTRGATFSCIAINSKNPIQKDIKKSRDAIIYQECSSEEDDDSLWTTAATFITLFLLSVFYGATITLVKVKWFISRILQFEMQEDNHFIAMLDPITQFQETHGHSLTPSSVTETR